MLISVTIEPMTKEEQQAQQKRLAYWVESARRDRDAAHSMLELRRFDWSLFIYHLALEKLLKALVVKAGVTPPPTHHLNRLAELAAVEPSEEQQSWLTEITDFNIEARYDDAKQSFYRKATEEYASLWHQHCSHLFSWLEGKLQ